MHVLCVCIISLLLHYNNYDHAHTYVYYSLIMLSAVIIQHPANDTYCEGTDAKLSCVIFDNTTTNAADTTVWINADTLFLVAVEMISNKRDANVVTSVLTIKNVSLSNDNGTQYFCSPRRDVDSFVGVISVAGESIYFTFLCTLSKRTYLVLKMCKAKLLR